MLGDNILIKKHTKERTLLGLYLPGQSAKNENTIGEVISVGPGFVAQKTGKLVPPDVKPGDFILAMDWSGEKLSGKKSTSIDMEDYKIIKEHAIWAKVKLASNMGLLDVEPYLDKILVRKTEDEMTTQGGIKLPDSHQMRGWTMAQVSKIGNGWKDLGTGFRYPSKLAVGEWLCVQRFAGSIMPFEQQKKGEQFWLVEEGPHIENNPYTNILYVDLDWKGWAHEKESA
jgi:chaperonin GroES